MSTTSLKQIAEVAGVSITTVSRVLRGQGDISQKTRQRVQEVAERLRYRPNMLVKGIQTGRTQTVGVMMSPEDAFTGGLLVGIQDALSVAGYAPMVLRVQWDAQGQCVGPSELEQIHRLIDRRVDGVILNPSVDTASDDYFKEVWDRGLPLVAVDRQLPSTKADFVGSDDCAGAVQAAKHLLSLGHRRLAQVAGPRSTSTGRQRREAFAQAVQAHRGASCCTLESPTFAGGYEQALELLGGSDRPTAVFAGNDLIAGHVYRAAQARGLRIPQDLSVVGFGDLPLGQWLLPQLTTIRQHPQTIGRRAAEILLGRLGKAGTQRAAKLELVEVDLEVRGSTAPLGEGF